MRIRTDRATSFRSRRKKSRRKKRAYLGKSRLQDGTLLGVGTRLDRLSPVGRIGSALAVAVEPRPDPPA